MQQRGERLDACCMQSVQNICVRLAAFIQVAHCSTARLTTLNGTTSSQHRTGTTTSQHRKTGMRPNLHNTGMGPHAYNTGMGPHVLTTQEWEHFHYLKKDKIGMVSFILKFCCAACIYTVKI